MSRWRESSRRTSGDPPALDATTPSDGERPGHRLIRHSILNAMGQGVPIAAAVVAVPFLVRAYGAERFGLLTLSWSLVGYASLFDFGMGRALTQAVAERRHTESATSLAPLVWTACAALTIAGVVIGGVGMVSANWVATSGLTISPGLQADARRALRVVSLGLPVVFLTTGVRGVLEAYERFDLVNAVRVPLGLSMFVAPLLALPISGTLTAAIVAILMARLIATIVFAAMALRVLPALRSRPAFSAADLGSLARFGAWMTVSNILSPLMSQADRFLIGSMLTASIVAYYTAPYEMVTRLTSAGATAIATALFPAFARWRDATATRTLFARGVALTSLVFVPLVVVLVAGASVILRLWLGGDFAEHGTAVLRILGVGVLFNGLAQIPFAHIQAIGRADLTAKLHLIESPLYLAALLFLIRRLGIEGAAIAWSLRTALDALLLFVVSRRLMAVPPPVALARVAQP